MPNIKKLVIAILLLKKFPADDIGQKIIIALTKKPHFSEKKILFFIDFAIINRPNNV